MISLESLKARKALNEADERGDRVKPTVDRMSDIQYKSVMYLGVFTRSYVILRFLAHGQTYRSNLQKTLFDTQGIWPDVKALYIWCDMSISDCLLGAKYVAVGVVQA